MHTYMCALFYSLEITILFNKKRTSGAVDALNTIGFLTE
ncbi:hypothetical protein B4077_6176 [Bacillus cereus]|uniref:Uncharacterized protein n=1 Tax=Bacillus cereus TaxID=1396 RepID=A0A0G8EE54_BACCE|nr:hypothetical protein B4077_6176 [Bacillus cereus]